MCGRWPQGAGSGGAPRTMTRITTSLAGTLAQQPISRGYVILRLRNKWAAIGRDEGREPRRRPATPPKARVFGGGDSRAHSAPFPASFTMNTPYAAELIATANAVVAAGKGILVRAARARPLCEEASISRLPHAPPALHTSTHVPTLPPPYPRPRTRAAARLASALSLWVSSALLRPGPRAPAGATSRVPPQQRV